MHANTHDIKWFTNLRMISVVDVSFCGYIIKQSHTVYIWYIMDWQGNVLIPISFITTLLLLKCYEYARMRGSWWAQFINQNNLLCTLNIWYCLLAKPCLLKGIKVTTLPVFSFYLLFISHNNLEDSFINIYLWDPLHVGGLISFRSFIFIKGFQS